MKKPKDRNTARNSDGSRRRRQAARGDNRPAREDVPPAREGNRPARGEKPPARGDRQAARGRRQAAREYPPVIALDVGTTKIACLHGELDGGGNLIAVTGIASVPARGMHKGVVVDMAEASESIRAAAEAAAAAAAEDEQDETAAAAGVFVGVAGSHVVSMNRRVSITNPNPDHRITRAERQALLRKLKEVDVSPDLKLIHALPREYMLDGQDGIKRPVGMYATNIEMEGHLVFGAVNSVQNLVGAVEHGGLRVDDIILEPLASSRACLSEQDMRSGTLLVDIGGGTTDIALFVSGRLAHSAVLPVGGNHITRDISVGLKVPLAAAEKIKLEFGHAQSHLVEDIEMARVMVEEPGDAGERPVTFSRKFLARIIEARVAEIFSLVLQQAKDSGYLSSVASGIVVTGGSSQLEGICGLAELVTEFPCRIGYPAVAGSIVDIPSNPVYATAVGLLLFGSERVFARGPSQPPEPLTSTLGLWEEVMAKVKGWFGLRNKT